jgi:hypothetical protein
MLTVAGQFVSVLGSGSVFPELMTLYSVASIAGFTSGNIFVTTMALYASGQVI